MEQYITFQQILNELETYQQGQAPLLNSYAFGSLYEMGYNNSGTTAQYPIMWVIPSTVIYDENTTTYQMQLIFADRLTTELDNQSYVISNMSLAARRVLSDIKRGNLMDYMDLTLPTTAIPFMERFNDHLAGVSLDVSLVVFEDINACPQY